MKKLFVCSEFYAGLLPFAATIVNAARDKDSFGIFICTTKCNYRKSIVPNGDNYIFLDFPKGKVNGLLHNIYPRTLLKTIEKVCKAQKIDVIHLLTEDSSLALHINTLKKQATVYYTVHDLFFHEKVYKNWLGWLIRTVLVKKRVTYLIKYTDNLVTCSKFQYEYMLKSFLKKQIYYHNFPTLVTDMIKSGSTPVPELHGIDNYILFFGQVEQYKGVDILYNAFINDEQQQARRKLVIAGKGHLYFERDLTKEQNVIFINRYIDDEEIRPLFSKACAVVFPYISGTQSGILSIPYYFNTPTLVSDIPFFTDMIVDNVTSISVDISHPAVLMQKIRNLETDDTAQRLTLEAALYYHKIYDPEILKKQLSDVYTKISNF